MSNSDIEFDTWGIQSLIDCYFPKHNVGVPLGYWKDNNDVMYKISEMPDNYLKNVINFLKDKDFIDKEEHIKVMKEELEERLKDRYGFYI